MALATKQSSSWQLVAYRRRVAYSLHEKYGGEENVGGSGGVAAGVALMCRSA